MKYYKYLPDLDWIPVAEKLKWYVLEYDKKPISYDDPNNMWQVIDQTDLHEQVPEIKNLFKPMNLTVRNTAFFVSTQMQNTIHRDGVPGRCRINIPILNCENTQTKFYVSHSKENRKNQPNGISYQQYDASECSYIDSYYLNCPVILRVNELHQVFQDYNRLPRVSCTIGFHENIEYLMED